MAEAQKEEQQDPSELLRRGVGDLEDAGSNEVAVDADDSDGYSEVEQRAMSMGWNPDFDGSDKEFVSAAEFIRRGELFSRIEKYKSSNEKLKTVVKGLVEHNKKIKEAEYARAIEDLKAQKLAALEEQDHKTALDIDDSLHKLQKEQETLEQDDDLDLDEEDTGPDPAYQAWADANPWYLKDDELTADADAFATAYIKRHGSKDTLPPAVDVLAYVDKKMKALHPDSFGKKSRKKVADVDSAPSGARRSGSKKKYTKADLNPTQRTLMETMLEMNPDMTEEKWIDDLVAIGELPRK